MTDNKKVSHFTKTDLVYCAIGGAVLGCKWYSFTPRCLSTEVSVWNWKIVVELRFGVTDLVVIDGLIKSL